MKDAEMWPQHLDKNPQLRTGSKEAGNSADLLPQSLGSADETLEAIVHGAPSGMYIWQDGRFVLYNDRFLDILGCDVDQLERTWPDGIPSGSGTRNPHTVAPTAAIAQAVVRPSDSTVPVDIEVSSVHGMYLGRPAIVGQIVDVSQHKRMDRQLKESEHRYRSLFEHNPDAVFSLQPDSSMVTGNPALERVTGYGPSELLPMGLFSIIQPGCRERVKHHVERALQGYPQSYETTITHKDGHAVDVQVTNIPVVIDGSVTGVIGILKDITRHRNAEAAMNQLVFFDALTALPNRVMFRTRLERAIDQSRQSGRKIAVLTLDLDRFKVINDTLGMNVGDRLLSAVSERLTKSVRDVDTVARTGGDEFSLLLRDIPSREDVLSLAGRILSGLEQPIIIDNFELHTSSSIGITVFPDDGGDVTTILENADTAMNSAKSQGRGYIQVYERQMTDAALEHLQLENDLRKALDRRELSVYYQPRVELLTGKVIGVEALLRWHHPNMGMISPAQFIPLAEESGLIVPIGRWVLETACAQARAWLDAGLPPVIMAVNLSARQFHQSGLLTTVADVLSSTELDPSLLELEITESIIMHNEEATTSTLNQLRATGVRISIDDFGTGYSSLTYLKRFPIDSIKIDQSFVCDIAQSHGDQAIAVAVITLAHSLSLKVVAEGVETLEQLHFLKEKACDEMQGFLYSKPVPAEECTDLLRGSQVTAAELDRTS